MNDKNSWKSKLSAILHDPITKVFDIKAHENVAYEILKELGIPIERGKEDQVASAMDRFPLPYELSNTKQIRVPFDRVCHPFSGNDLTNVVQGKVESLKDLDLKGYFKDLVDDYRDDYKKAYHVVWWNLPFIATGAQFLPADTRVPNHSIVDHLDITAALKPAVTSNEGLNASLISVSIGPVQELIAQARKTVDLWAGSYLLSYLIYQAIECVGLNYGFDAIIYPYMRGIPFVRETLVNKINIDRADLRYPLPNMSDKVAALPNLFVAIVPSGNAEDVLKACKDKIKQAWCDLAMRSKGFIKKEEGEFKEDVFCAQVNLFPTINTASFPLCGPEDVLGIVKKHFTGSGIEKYNDALEKVKNSEGYKLNAGAYYRYSYRLLTSKLAAKKSIRYFPPYKGSVGVDSANNPDDFGGNVKACTRFVEVLGGEEKRDLLGAVNSVKRVLKDVLGKSIKYESTSDIALMNEVNKKIADEIRKGYSKEEALKKLENGYFAVLMMDGDEMGKWVSGEKAPKFESLVHEDVKKAFESDENLKDAWNVLKELPAIQPAYHKGVSRTLGLFSSLVERVIEKYEGMLVYCGGDDVLALLPADKVVECANELRKWYSGIGKVEISDGSHKYCANDEILYVDDQPFAPLMGKRASISAGITIVNHKYPLQVALKMARESEEHSKEKLGRNAFTIVIVKRSGQITEVGAKWGNEPDDDLLAIAYDVLEEMDKFDVSTRSLYKFNNEDAEIFKDNYGKLIEYVVRRSVPEIKEENRKREFEEFIHKFKNFVDKFATSQVDDKQTSDESFNPLRNAVDLLRALRFTKRGDRE